MLKYPEGLDVHHLAEAFSTFILFMREAKALVRLRVLFGSSEPSRPGTLTFKVKIIP